MILWSFKTSLLTKLFFCFILICFNSFSQEADSLSKDFVSEGFKIHGYVMNITDIAKINTIRKPMFLGVNGVQLTTFTKENNWWKNGMFSVYVLNSYGDNPTTDYLGDYQMFDNIESFPDTNNHVHIGNGQLNYRTFIYNLYYQHFYKKGRLLLGQCDLNTDFAFSNIGLNFINSSFGLQPTIAYNVPSFSTFPFTNLSARVEYNINEKVSYRTAIAQGVGGNHLTNPHSTKYVETLKDGGLFFINEISRGNYVDDILKSDVKLGVWMHSGSKSLRFTNYNKSDSTKNHVNFGAYFIMDKLLFSEKKDSSQGLYSFVDLGFSPGDYNIFNYYTGIGFSYKGLFPKRDNDILSVGFASPFFSKGLVDKKGYYINESNIELNYNFVNENFNIQPCVQFVNDIAGNRGNNSIVFMIRFYSRKGVLY